MPPKAFDREKIEFKEKFIERYSQLTNFDEFKNASLKFLRRSIRVNTNKITVDDLKKRLVGDWSLDPVPWCKEGFWIEHKGKEKRRDVGNLKEHMLGYIYIQEAASMIPPLVLDPKPGEIILDLCAAPGSKSTQISQYMENKGILVCNDFKGDRMASLGLNTQRMGCFNTVLTMMHGQQFARKEQKFDRVLVDAPCSGTGTISKSLKTIQIWNPNMIKRISYTQKKLIETGFKILKEEGMMVYSTCSCEPEENEGVVSWLLENYPKAELLDIDLDINRSKPVSEFQGEKYSGVEKCLRIWPQDNNTEGFFVAKIFKKKK